MKNERTSDCCAKFLTTFCLSLRSMCEEMRISHTTNLEQLVKEHTPMLLRYLRRLGCPPTLAEDLSQETFLSLLEKPFEEVSAKATASYLRLVARNLFIDEKRRQKKAVSLDTVPEEIQHEEQSKPLIETLQSCLPKLRERPRRALELRYWKKLSIASIAALMGIKESGVKTLLGRAKQRLRELMNRSLFGVR